MLYMQIIRGQRIDNVDSIMESLTLPNPKWDKLFNSPVKSNFISIYQSLMKMERILRADAWLFSALESILSLLHHLARSHRSINNFCYKPFKRLVLLKQLLDD